jgi:hypothetical protein
MLYEMTGEVPHYIRLLKLGQKYVVRCRAGSGPGPSALTGITNPSKQGGVSPNPRESRG